MFIAFAAAVIAWSLFTLRWTFRRKRAATPLLLVTLLLLAAASASIACDLRQIGRARRATPSGVTVRIRPQETWWELDYGTFVTANELHVPAGGQITLTLDDLPPPWPCMPAGEHRCTLVGEDARDLHFIRLWPPMWRRLRIVSDPQFARWMNDQARPAHAPDGALFVSAGCGDCHVVRGVTSSPAFVAPDLTHFASRATIGAANLPNRTAFLQGWIASSRSLDPHSRMPDMPLAPHDLHAVTHYLESLR